MHFSVGVITRGETTWEVEKLLRPFHSDSFNASYIYITKEEFIKKKREQYGVYLNSSEYQEYKKDKKLVTEKKRIFKDLENALKLTDDEFLAYVKKAEKITRKYFDSADNFLYLYNSREAFDEWIIGGKYDDFLRLMDGTRACAAAMNEIVWKSDMKRISTFHEIWEQIVEQDVPILDKGNRFYSKNKADLLRIYGTKNDFLNAHSMMVPDVILTPNGKWHYPVFSKTENLITPKPDEVVKLHQIMKKYSDCYITIVDCHGGY